MHLDKEMNMNSLKFVFLFSLIMACQNSSEKSVEDESCECATIRAGKFAYAGITNPFYIVSNCPENTDFSISSNAEVTFVSKKHFLVKADKPMRVRLELNVKEGDETKKLDEFSFGMRRIPPPTAALNRIGKSTIGLGELDQYISDSGIRAELLNHDIEIKFPIVSYNITIAKEGQKFLSCQNEGYKFETDCQEILRQASLGDILIFDKIITKIPIDKELEIQPLVLRVK